MALWLSQRTKCPFNDNITHFVSSDKKKAHYSYQYIMQRGGWSSDKTLKAIYRGTIKDYEEKFTDMALSHFEDMQHEKEKA